MCTAATYGAKDHYFGRNMDYEYEFPASVTIAPRNYPLPFHCLTNQDQHFAMIGMALLENDYPLYFDATNEYGLSMAALNFPGYAVYNPEKKDALNVAPYELIPWILGQCKSLQEARRILDCANITALPFSAKYPLSPLHWILADCEGCLVIESTEAGLRIYDNPVGVLTNSPPFDYHMHNLTNYLNVTSEEAVNRFSERIELQPSSRGMGGIGLPGDLSSSSRFVRAVFTRLNSVSKGSEDSSISQFFHILGSVAQTEGCAKVGELYEKTLYTSCCNVTKGIYYYTTYENSQITGVNMHSHDLNHNKLIIFPIRKKLQIKMET